MQQYYSAKGVRIMEGRLTKIDRAEALRYLQYRGDTVPEELERQLDRCERMLMDAARPRVTWQLYDLSPDMTLTGTAMTLPGNQVRRLLKDCGRVILMAATLGMEAETLLRRAQKRSMAEAVLLDALGSAAIENVCDNLCADLAAMMAPRYLTVRFSPGYGDMPLSQQRGFFDTLDVTRRIGVTLTESGLMAPQKSVTALMGVSDRPQPQRRDCADCANYDTCAYRKEGNPCETK